MPPTRSSKKQTRLAFTPLSPSSPQSASLPSHLQPRAASVRYNDSASPTKRRRVLDIDATPKIPTASTPSRPLGSRQDSDEGQGSAEDPVMLSPFKRPWTSDKTRPSKRISRGLPTPDPSSQLQFQASDSDGETISSDTDSTPVLPKARLAQASTPRSKLRKVRRAQLQAKTNSITEDDEDNILPKHMMRSRAAKAVVLSSDEDMDREITLSSPQQRHQRPKGTTVNVTPTKPRNHERVLRTSRTSSNKVRSEESGFKIKSAQTERRVESYDSDSTLPDVASLLTPRATKEKAASIISDNESDLVATPHRSSRGKKLHSKAPTFDYETEESEDVVATTSKRKRLTRRTEQSERKPTPRKQDDVDLQEDLEVLQDTELRPERTRGKPAPSKRNAALEKLKARRVGQKVIDLSSESEAPVKTKRALYDHDSVSETESKEDAYRDEDEDEERKNEAIRRSLRDDEGEYDEDFVVDDQEETLGAPGVLEDIPLEYTRHAHKRPKEHFKDVVEWMVHKKLNPAFPRNDTVYRVGFRKLDDEVSGYAGSKFLSAAWTGDFAQAIKARPRYSDVPLPFDSFGDLHYCEACNRRNHPAKFIITFAGKAYHKQTLEDVSEDDDGEENDSDDEEAGSRNADGFLLPSVDKQYYVGRFCKENAEIAHSLLHWRYHLNDWILDWLKNEGYETPEKIVEREEWNIKKRNKYANKVVDDMEQKGEIRALYRDFKANLDTARNYKPDYRRSR